jgi:hypothetical protein
MATISGSSLNAKQEGKLAHHLLLLLLLLLLLVLLVLLLLLCCCSTAAGSGLSGALLSQLQLPWLGLDISSDMLQVGSSHVWQCRSLGSTHVHTICSSFGLVWTSAVTCCKWGPRMPCC